MNKNKRLILLAVRIFVIVIVSVILLGMTAPIYFVITRSFSSAEDMLPTALFPGSPVGEHFAELFNGAGSTGLPYSRSFFASLVITLITALLQVAVVCPMAYVLAKVKAPGITVMNRVIEWSLLLTPLTLYVPQYFLMLKLGISNSLFAEILPFVASPLMVYLVKRYMSVIPDEVIYSARLNGASHFGIFFCIVLPGIKPAIAAVVGLSLINAWGATGELFVYSAELKPIAAIMPLFAASEEKMGLFCAAAVVVAVPIIVLGTVFSKEIAKTAALAGIKQSSYCKKIKVNKAETEKQ